MHLLRCFYDSGRNFRFPYFTCSCSKPFTFISKVATFFWSSSSLLCNSRYLVKQNGKGCSKLKKYVLSIDRQENKAITPVYLHRFICISQLNRFEIRKISTESIFLNPPFGRRGFVVIFAGSSRGRCEFRVRSICECRTCLSTKLNLRKVISSISKARSLFASNVHVRNVRDFLNLLNIKPY